MSSLPKLEHRDEVITTMKTQYEGYPTWYAKQLATNQPIDISKFDGDLEGAVNFYFKQVNKLFFANNVLNTQLKAAIEQKNQLANAIASLQKNQKNSSDQKKKRHRRCASEIQRKYICPVQKCQKSYGTEGSLLQHMKLKHPQIEYIPQGDLKSEINQADESQKVKKSEQDELNLSKQNDLNSFCNIIQLPKSYNIQIQIAEQFKMQVQVQKQEIAQYIKEYLKYWELNTTLQIFEDQNKKKSNKIKNPTNTKLEQVMKLSTNKTKNETQLEKDNKIINKKYQEVLQAGRQIFAVSINLLQIIHNIKDSGNQKYDALNDTIQNYKIQLGKHHKMIINEGRVQGTELISESVIKDHKHKLQQHFARKQEEGIIQILLSLRVNALQIAPQLRKSLVQQLIRRDIFKITQTQNFDFLQQILKMRNKSLKHAITSLISVIVSTLRGIQYITYGGDDVIIQRIIKILKQQENGNVTQRFCLAILQKCSVKDSLISVYLDSDMISWSLSLVKKSLHSKIHMFCLDFATAMLANILHSKTCQSYLQKKPEMVVSIMQDLLKNIKLPSLQVSVLMHLLISLSYLCRQRFSKQMQDVHMQKRIQQFVQFYQGLGAKQDGEAAQMDKRTVLDLCSHMFHGKQEENDTEDRIRQYENEQGELIFECFQDQVN